MSKIIQGPKGEPMMLLTMEEYQDLLDARDAALAMQAVQTGEMETVSSEDALAYVETRTPLAFWRQHRGLTQQALAEATGVSQAYIAQIESGAREGRPGVLRDLARALRIRIEDLIA